MFVQTQVMPKKQVEDLKGEICNPIATQAQAKAYGCSPVEQITIGNVHTQGRCPSISVFAKLVSLNIVK